MSSVFDRMQKQIPQAREQDEVSAKEKNKQKEYEQSWREAKIACNAFDGNPKKEPDIAPFRRLAQILVTCEQVKSLKEMLANLCEVLEKHEQDRTAAGRAHLPIGYEAGDRLAEARFIECLLSLAKDRPNERKARQLLHNCGEACAISVGNVAANIQEYLRDHKATMERLGREKEAEMLVRAGPVVQELSSGQSKLRRNLWFLHWSTVERLKPSQIKVRWHKERQDKSILKKSGVSIVRQGLRYAKDFLNELSARGFPLTAMQAIERLPE